MLDGQDWRPGHLVEKCGKCSAIYLELLCEPLL